MQVYGFDHRSTDWDPFKVGKVTGDRAQICRDFVAEDEPSESMLAYAAQIALERMTGNAVPPDMPDESDENHRAKEALARAAYDTQYAAINGGTSQISKSFGSDNGRFLYSPDGTIGTDGLIEIKTLTKSARIANVVGKGLIDDFLDECLFGLWITGRKWVDLVFWAPSIAMAGKIMTVRRIMRDEQRISALAADMQKFLNLALVSQIEILNAPLASPEVTEDDAQIIADSISKAVKAMYGALNPDAFMLAWNAAWKYTKDGQPDDAVVAGVSASVQGKTAEEIAAAIVGAGGTAPSPEPAPTPPVVVGPSPVVVGPSLVVVGPT